MPTSPDTVFEKAGDAGASDVHLVVGHPVIFRIDGDLEPQGKTASTAPKITEVMKAILGETQYKRFEQEKEIDASYSTKSGLRLRINCHYERGNPGLVARLIPEEIPSLEDLHLEHLEDLCYEDSGLILFTGPTGTGKSTSMASMLQHMADTKPGHIVTLEDPIEFVFKPGEEGLVRQRQMGTDFTSFPEAMRRVLRQDPDVIMVGEMRDLETISAALTLAETGHVVFATLHTPNAIQTIDRMVDVFPPYQQSQVRAQLSLSLKAVIAQRLLPCTEGGRVAQREVLINNHAVANIIREARTPELVSVLQTGSSEGMCTYENHAKQLYKDGLIDKETYNWAKDL